MTHRLLLLVLLASFGFAGPAEAAGSSSSSTRTAAQPSSYDQGVQAVEAGDYQRALGLMEQVVRSEPDNADAWNYVGFSNRKLDQFDQALAAYQKALAIDPEHRGANEYLGELYLQMGEVDKARERLDQLDRSCTFGCEEYDDLKEAIERYQSG
jgi:tetratricopeptide (TPR) repeat protein